MLARCSCRPCITWWSAQTRRPRPGSRRSSCAPQRSMSMSSIVVRAGSGGDQWFLLLLLCAFPPPPPSFLSLFFPFSSFYSLLLLLLLLSGVPGHHLLSGRERNSSLTVYKTSFPVLLGMPADLLGAERSTSGVNFAARMVIMKSGVGWCVCTPRQPVFRKQVGSRL